MTPTVGTHPDRLFTLMYFKTETHAQRVNQHRGSDVAPGVFVCVCGVA